MAIQDLSLGKTFTKGGSGKGTNLQGSFGTREKPKTTVSIGKTPVKGGVDGSTGTCNLKKSAPSGYSKRAS